MSYCRSNGTDSDVYVIGSLHHLECFGAGWRLEEEIPVHDKFLAADWTFDEASKKLVKLDSVHISPKMFTTTSRQAMIDHLLVHRKAGHKVPEYALELLRQEIQEAGDEY